MGESARWRLQTLARQLGAADRDAAAAAAAATSHGETARSIGHGSITAAGAPTGAPATRTLASPRCKACTAEQAVATIQSGCGVTVGGFVGSGCPEALLNALRARFDASGTPRGLKLLLPVSSGDRCAPPAAAPLRRAANPRPPRA